MNLRALFLSAAAAASFVSAPVAAEALTQPAIIELTKLGLGDEAIIAKIKADGTVFDLTAQDMISLKQDGVTSPVIAAMLNNRSVVETVMSMDSPDPRVAHPSGLYLITGSGETGKMLRIDPTVSNQAKTGGVFGYALTGGLASASVKVAIQNASATAKATRTPRFYFFFDQANNVNNGSAWASGLNTVVSSPAEFTLVRLERKSDRREARVGSMNIAGAKTGVMDKDRVPFQHQMVRPGVYQIDLPSALLPGEYGFLFSLGGAGTAGAMTARIFDFSVQ
jgi:hypothetical protein